MKTITTLTAALALLAAPLAAEDYPTQIGEPVAIEKGCCSNPGPERETDGPDFADALPFILAIGAIVWYAESQREPVVTLVEPEQCMGKVNGFDAFVPWAD